MRKNKITRETNETKVSVSINLDGTGEYSNDTNVGFFDHMLDQLSRHSLIDLKVKTTGDTEIDDHHTVEDTGIALGQAVKNALGNKQGIVRYGSCHLPMDDAQIRTSLDFSSRPYFIWNVSGRIFELRTFRRLGGLSLFTRCWKKNCRAIGFGYER